MRSLKLNKERLKSLAKEIATTAILIFIVANAISFFRAPDIQDKALPEINTLLTNQELYSTLDYKDKPLLVHFWATWCPTCKLEAGNIQSLSENYDVLTIAVKSGDDAKINAYLNEHDLNFKVINDQEGILASQFSVSAFPTTFIYDKEGKLCFSEVGYTSTWGLYLRMWWAKK
ncbi:protein disulfide oxidoreductase [Campylobacterota bacterium]